MITLSEKVERVPLARKRLFFSFLTRNFIRFFKITKLMALRVKRTDINDDQAYFIRSHLYFQPKQSFLSERYSQQAKNPVLFYLVRDGDVFLPLTFGRAFTQTFSNREYPPTSFDFTGELFSHQVPVAEEAQQSASILALERR